jgi:hypothetical protein
MQVPHRSRLPAAVGAALLLLFALLAYDELSLPAFDRAQFNRVQAGMTLAEVEAILGWPTGQGSPWATVGTVCGGTVGGGPVDYQALIDEINDSGPNYRWENRDHCIEVLVSKKKGTVVSTHYADSDRIVLPFTRYLQRIKRLLRIE